jgi:hypothetical protein
MKAGKLVSPPKPKDAARSVRPRDALSRIADAIEKLADDPQIEIEAGPPICANCGKFDPVIHLNATEAGKGKMSELIVDGTCTECGSAIYVLIESYSVHRSRLTAVEEIKERERVGFFTNGNVR